MKIKSVNLGISLLLLVMLLSLSGSAFARENCDLPPVIDCHEYPHDPLHIYGSQNDYVQFGVFTQAYDNFTFDRGTISTISWAGGYINPSQQGQIKGWNVGVYTDNGGQPGSLLAFTHVSGTANQTLLGNFSGTDIYEYYLSGLDWTVNPGVQYWLSVYPDLAYPSEWGWANAGHPGGRCDGCDGLAYQDNFGVRSALSDDLALGIGDADVPEPTGLGLIGSAVVGVSELLRRRLLR